MKHFLLCLVSIFLFIPYQIFANNTIGGDISYRHLGGLKYELTFRLYRDCRGLAFPTNINAEMIGDATYTKKLSITRVNIIDRSTFCKKDSSSCSPANKPVSLKYPAMEEHVFMDTVDFDNEDSDFIQYCNIGFGIGQCCRPGSINTGGASKNFWVWGNLDICKAKDNSSPVFPSFTSNLMCCNQPFYYSFNAVDSIDGDSLSYEFAEPMAGWTTKVPYSSSFNYKFPFSVYWPSGYDRNKGPKPDLNPPIGMYLDPERGDMTFTPTNCSEVTVTSIKVKEWRKDSTGKYVNIGEIRRDMTFIVQTCTGNNAPILGWPYKYEVCLGDKICFNITSDDKVFYPPPPAKPNPPDTVTLTWDMGIKRGATFTIVDTTARLQSARFCWTPQTSDIRSIPYSFSMTARDNNCPVNALITRSYSVLVKETLKTKRTYRHIKNGLYELRSNVDIHFTEKIFYSWTILDTLLNPVDKTSIDIYRTPNGIQLTGKIDSIQFIKPGKYIIRHYIQNPPNYCSAVYYDTLEVKGPITPFLKLDPYEPIIKWVCKNSSHTLSVSASNAKNPLKYRWSSSKKDTLSILNVTITKDTTFKVDVYDAAGYHRTAKWSFYLFKNPLLNQGNTISVCYKDSFLFKAVVPTYATDTILWSWYFENKKIGEKTEIKVDKPGKYIVEITDGNKCSLKKDSSTLLNYSTKVLAGPDKDLCPGLSVTLRAKDSAGLKSVKYEWYEIRNLKADTLISFLDSVKVKPSSDRSYFVKQVSISGQLKCISLDTVKVIVRTEPEVLFSKPTICQNQLELDLNKVILKPIDPSKGVLSWQLIKTLPRPGGVANTLNDLIYDKDTSQAFKYFIKVDESTIKLTGKLRDTLILSLVYKDEFGCTSTSANKMSIVVRASLNILFARNQLSKCHADSVINLTSHYGPNQVLGKWFTENDSTGFSKWPQGDEIPLGERFSTKNLNASGGEYLAKYSFKYNECVCAATGKLKIVSYPKIRWSQKNTVNNKVVLKDLSANVTGRTWYLDGIAFSQADTIVLDKNQAIAKSIRLSITNQICSTDSIIKPVFAGVNMIDKRIVNIYPNPADNFLYIETDNAEPYKLSVINTLGQIVLTTEMKGGNESLDISLIAKGVYSLILFNGKETMRKLFIKE